MTTISADSSININDMFKTIISDVTTNSTNLKKQLESIKGESLSPEAMLSLQFAVGQYNTLLEAASTVTKSITDETKNLAQRN